MANGIDTNSLSSLLQFAQSHGLHVTSGEHFDADGNPVVPKTGHAGPNDPHYIGRAVDLGMKGVGDQQFQQIVSDAQANGLRVLDERYTGGGKYGYSSGPHLHVEVPVAGGGSQGNQGLTPIQQLIVKTAKSYGVDPSFALGLAEQESSFNPKAVGPVIPKTGQRAVGLFQFIPGTATQYGLTNRADPEASTDAAMRYVKDLLHTNGGDYPQVLRRFGGNPAPDSYVQQVMARKAQWDNRFGGSSDQGNPASPSEELHQRLMGGSTSNAPPVNLSPSEELHQRLFSLIPGPTSNNQPTLPVPDLDGGAQAPSRLSPSEELRQRLLGSVPPTSSIPSVGVNNDQSIVGTMSPLAAPTGTDTALLSPALSYPPSPGS